MKTKILLCLAGIALSGCAGIFSTGGSGEFACPGMPKGVTCKSPREVYELSISGKQKKTSKTNGYNPGPVEVVLAGRGDADLEPMPVLEQARVMRIWIAPWVDKNKDLHWPGMIFTQVQSRQWKVGNDNFEGIEPPVPHRISSSMPLLPQKQSDGDAGMKLPPKSQDEILN